MLQSYNQLSILVSEDRHFYAEKVPKVLMLTLENSTQHLVVDRSTGMVYHDVTYVLCIDYRDLGARATLPV